MGLQRSSCVVKSTSSYKEKSINAKEQNGYNQIINRDNLAYIEEEKRWLHSNADLALLNGLRRSGQKCQAPMFYWVMMTERSHLSTVGRLFYEMYTNSKKGMLYLEYLCTTILLLPKSDLSISYLPQQHMQILYK